MKSATALRPISSSRDETASVIDDLIDRQNSNSMNWAYEHAMLKPEEIAAPVLFLAGEGSNYMLGAEVAVDGGRAEL